MPYGIAQYSHRLYKGARRDAVYNIYGIVVDGILIIWYVLTEKAVGQRETIYNWCNDKNWSRLDRGRRQISRQLMCA